jgi:ribosomal protein S16
MVIMIRLARAGTVRRPIFRMVVADKKSPRDGKHLEKVSALSERRLISHHVATTLRWTHVFAS